MSVSQVKITTIIKFSRIAVPLYKTSTLQLILKSFPSIRSVICFYIYSTKKDLHSSKAIDKTGLSVQVQFCQNLFAPSNSGNCFCGFIFHFNWDKMSSVR